MDYTYTKSGAWYRVWYQNLRMVCMVQTESEASKHVAVLNGMD